MSDAELTRAERTLIRNALESGWSQLYDRQLLGQWKSADYDALIEIRDAMRILDRLEDAPTECPGPQGSSAGDCLTSSVPPSPAGPAGSRGGPGVEGGKVPPRPSPMNLGVNPGAAAGPHRIEDGEGSAMTAIYTTSVEIECRISVRYRYDPGCRAVTEADPEFCHPAEAASVEIIEAKLAGPYDVDVLCAVSEKELEDICEQVMEDHLDRLEAEREDAQQRQLEMRARLFFSDTRIAMGDRDNPTRKGSSHCHTRDEEST